jgi:hypothetical protein
MTDSASPHRGRRCASADIFKDHHRDHAPDGRESSPTMCNSPDLYFNSRSRKPIYQPSSTPNVCQPTLTAHCYLDSPTNKSIDYSSDFSGGFWDQDQYSESTMPPSLSPTPTAGSNSNYNTIPPRSTTDSRSKNWNYDPSIHQPKYRYVPVQVQGSVGLPPPPIPPPPMPSALRGPRPPFNNNNTTENLHPYLYRSVRYWNPRTRRGEPPNDSYTKLYYYYGVV